MVDGTVTQSAPDIGREKEESFFLASFFLFVEEEGEKEEDVEK